MKKLLSFLLASSLFFSVAAQGTFSVEELQADIDLAVEAYRTLHPGLYRYLDETSLTQAETKLRERLGEPTSLAEAFLAFTEFTGKIQCGHTYANFWNQKSTTQALLFNQPDKLPFTFQWYEDEILVLKNVSEVHELGRGARITAINGIPAEDILASLLPYMKADGTNDAKRIHGLQIEGGGKFEFFDIYFPLLYPPTEGTYQLEVIPWDGEAPLTVQVEAITREERIQRLESSYGPVSQKPDDLWEFHLVGPGVAYLATGSFTTWHMEMNWKQFLKEAFQTLEREDVHTLIYDIRGLEGGDNDVLKALAGHLFYESVQLPGQRELVTYTEVPASIRPHVGTWTDTYYNLKGRVESYDDRFYQLKRSSPVGRTWRGKRSAFSGKVYLLTDAANSSAGFTLAQAMKATNRGTLVGQTTGGSQQGINGGQMFFLTLPNTGIELDVPLIGYFPTEATGSGGVVPHQEIIPTLDQIVAQEDPVMEWAMEQIALSNSEAVGKR
ncbi:MAG TPA: hypothetical protein DCP28_36760 [Cytophagales bacterium]|nr:hypothetical protein [Cytophagales bacterium]